MKKLNLQQIPDTVEDIHGVEQVKVKAKLK